MSGLFGELNEIESAILTVPQVRGVSALRSLEDGTVVVTRVGLSPKLRLAEVVLAVAEVEHCVKRADERIRSVFVEPDIASDSATPTETIVIRALD